MAQDLDDGEFWLPSEFLTDDDLLTDFKSHQKGFGDFSPGFGFNSDLNSPGESVTGSTEMESDEDDFITGLTWKMANASFLHDSNQNPSSDYVSKGWKLSGSPQSTLCGCKPGSSRGSPNSASRVSSPPDGRDLGWDLLYAAAGEVARMRMIEEAASYHSTKQHFPPPKPSPVSIPVEKPVAGGFFPNQIQNQHRLTYLQLQASQRMKQQQQQQQQQMIRSGGWGQGRMDYNFNNGRAVGSGRNQTLSTAAWPTLQQSQQQQQQQTGSGMRAVFLGGPAAKKERTGTGVFLPRRVGTNPPEVRKKSGCSTVLLPERVVHALNLNLESIDARSLGNYTSEYDASLNLNHRNNNVLIQEKRNLLPQPVMYNPELRLPQEWTY